MIRSHSGRNTKSIPHSFVKNSNSIHRSLSTSPPTAINKSSRNVLDDHLNHPEQDLKPFSNRQLHSDDGNHLFNRPGTPTIFLDKVLLPQSPTDDPLILKTTSSKSKNRSKRNLSNQELHSLTQKSTSNSNDHSPSPNLVQSDLSNHQTSTNSIDLDDLNRHSSLNASYQSHHHHHLEQNSDLDSNHSIITSPNHQKIIKKSKLMSPTNSSTSNPSKKKSSLNLQIKTTSSMNTSKSSLNQLTPSHKSLKTNFKPITIKNSFNFQSASPSLRRSRLSKSSIPTVNSRVKLNIHLPSNVIDQANLSPSPSTRSSYLRLHVPSPTPQSSSPHPPMQSQNPTPLTSHQNQNNPSTALTSQLTNPSLLNLSDFHSTQKSIVKPPTPPKPRVWNDDNAFRAFQVEDFKLDLDLTITCDSAQDDQNHSAHHKKKKPRISLGHVEMVLSDLEKEKLKDGRIIRRLSLDYSSQDQNSDINQIESVMSAIPEGLESLSSQSDVHDPIPRDSHPSESSGHRSQPANIVDQSHFENSQSNETIPRKTPRTISPTPLFDNLDHDRSRSITLNSNRNVDLSQDIVDQPNVNSREGNLLDHETYRSSLESDMKSEEVIPDQDNNDLIPIANPHSPVDKDHQLSYDQPSCSSTSSLIQLEKNQAHHDPTCVISPNFDVSSHRATPSFQQSINLGQNHARLEIEPSGFSLDGLKTKPIGSSRLQSPFRTHDQNQPTGSPVDSTVNFGAGTSNDTISEPLLGLRQSSEQTQLDQPNENILAIEKVGSNIHASPQSASHSAEPTFIAPQINSPASLNLQSHLPASLLTHPHQLLPCDSDKSLNQASIEYYENEADQAMIQQFDDEVICPDKITNQSVKNSGPVNTGLELNLVDKSSQNKQERLVCQGSESQQTVFIDTDSDEQRSEHETSLLPDSLTAQSRLKKNLGDNHSNLRATCDLQSPALDQVRLNSIHKRSPANLQSKPQLKHLTSTPKASICPPCPFPPMVPRAESNGNKPLTAPIIEISSANTQVAARAAAILKVYHGFIPRGCKAAGHAGLVDGHDLEIEMEKSIRMEEAQADRSAYSRYHSATPAGQSNLRSIQVNEVSLDDNFNRFSSPKLRTTPRVDYPESLPPSRAASIRSHTSLGELKYLDYTPNFEQWTQRDWRVLEACLKKLERFNQRENVGLASEIVDPGDVVLKMLSVLKLNSHNCEGEWEWSKMVHRVIALQSRRSTSFIGSNSRIRSLTPLSDDDRINQRIYCNPNESIQTDADKQYENSARNPKLIPSPPPISANFINHSTNLIKCYWNKEIKKKRRSGQGKIWEIIDKFEDKIEKEKHSKL
ncbi:hypothetical protein O181_046110 [Austropuccinia psidii MF-1]|uniref:Uncharacterized protein n=1 Tax=Austropuccinia psidii MF-1 TaxID=1389203 RepID=A0A9Q3HLV0_9BASI|nr:hypothetical protein [Austropuccinia psidii MF-1]